jgi:hypothetical protein
MPPLCSFQHSKTTCPHAFLFRIGQARRRSTRRQSGQDTEQDKTPTRARRRSGKDADQGKTPIRARCRSEQETDQVNTLIRARPRSGEDADQGKTPIRARRRSGQDADQDKTPIRARNRSGQDNYQGLSYSHWPLWMLLTRVCDGGAGVGRGDPFFRSTLHGLPLFYCREKHVTGQSPQCQLFSVCLIREWILGKSVFSKTFFENLDLFFITCKKVSCFSIFANTI